MKLQWLKDILGDSYTEEQDAKVCAALGERFVARTDFNDKVSKLKEAEAYAAKVGKPLFIDFTGHGCVNCREMEARVWSDPQVLDILRNDYVIVALYSDDKKVLPESEWVTTDAGKVLKSLGKINSYYALKTFGVNAQPYYVLQGRGGKELVPPRGYDLDVQGFVDFLRSGVEAYDRQK